MHLNYLDYLFGRGVEGKLLCVVYFTILLDYVWHILTLYIIFFVCYLCFISLSVLFLYVLSVCLTSKSILCATY